MLRNRDSLIEVCEVIADNEHLKVTVREAGKCAAMAGGSAFVGALLGGPIGSVIGATAGSITSAVWSWGKYKSVVSILRNDLTPSQKRKLEASLRRVMNNLNVEDAAALLCLVIANSDLKAVIIKEIAGFLLNEMNLTVMS